MKFKLLISLTLLCSIAFAQDVNISFDSKEMKAFLAGTVYIVPTGDKTIDDSIASAFKNYWKQTPFEMLTKENMNSYLQDETKYFIASFFTKKGNAVMGTVDGYDERYNTLDFIIFPGKKKMRNLGQGVLDNITDAYLPFTEKKNIPMCISYGVKKLNDIISTTMAQKYNSRAQESNRFVFRKFFCNPQILKNRTLLVPENLVKQVLSTDVLAEYKYQYKVVSIDELVSLITSADAGKYCYIPENCIENITIFDPVTKALIYSGPVEMSMKRAGSIVKKEIDDLNRDILKPVKIGKQ